MANTELAEGVERRREGKKERMKDKRDLGENSKKKRARKILLMDKNGSARRSKINMV